MKYLIMWNAGYGTETDVVDVDSLDEAENIAYESWKEAVESQADYTAEPLTQDNAEDWGHEDEL